MSVGYLMERDFGDLFTSTKPSNGCMVEVTGLFFYSSENRKMSKKKGPAQSHHMMEVSGQRPRRPDATISPPILAVIYPRLLLVHLPLQDTEGRVGPALPRHSQSCSVGRLLVRETLKVELGPR